MARRRKKSALILAEMCAFIGLLVLSWAPSYSSMIKAVAAGNEKGDEDTLIEEENVSGHFNLYRSISQTQYQL